MTQHIAPANRIKLAWKTGSNLVCNNPAPAVLCRLSDLRYIEVNQAFSDMTGYTRQQVLDKTIYEFDVLHVGDGRQACIKALKSHRAIPQTNANLRLHDGLFKHVAVAGQPLEVAGSTCVLFTFVDLDSARKVKSELKHSQRLFKTAFDLSPVPMVIFSASPMGFMEVNPAGKELFGYTLKELQQNAIESSTVWHDRCQFTRLKVLLADHGHTHDFEIKLMTAHDQVLDCLVSAKTVKFKGDDAVLAVIQDVTEQNTTQSDLMAAMDEVMKDTSWFSQRLIEKLAHVRSSTPDAQSSTSLQELTAREREVLEQMCCGRSDDQIAGDLDIAPNTVRNYVSSLYGKLGVHRRATAIIWGRERGITGSQIAEE